MPLMDMMEHREKLVSFLETVAKPGFPVGNTQDDTTNLIQAGIVDSFALIQIIFYLEQNYGMNLQTLGIDPADLVSIDGILTAIQRSGG